MRKRIKIIILSVLLAAGVIVCAVRWQAWFGMPAEPAWTGDTLSYQFHTFGCDSIPGFVAGEKGWSDTISPESLDILVFGDIHNHLKRTDYDSIAARVPQADAIAQVGDWMERGQFYYYQLLLREWVGNELSNRPVINCPGNHEYSKGLHKELHSGWAEAFPYPQNGPVGVPGVNYYIDFEQLRFIVIDTSPLDRLVYLTRTETWLRGAMQSAGGRYITVMLHHPVISVRKGRFNPMIYATFRYVLREADLVLCGHDHSYMRRMPFVIVNTAGTVKPQRSNPVCEMAAEDPVYSLLTIRQEADELLWRTYRMGDGTLIDSIDVKHDRCDSTGITAP